MHIPTTGKWYFEYNITQKDISFPGFFRLQLMDENNTEVLDLGYVYSGAGVVNYNGFYEFYTNGENAFTQNQGDIIGISVNRDTGMAYLYRNGVLVISGNISSTTTEIAILFVGRDGGTPNIDVLNFGQDSSFAGNKTRQGNTDANGIGDFYYTPPTGYLALCTDNLPEPAIVDSETQFNVVTYTGTGTTNSVSGVGFQPDFVWIKNRSAVSSNKLMDVVRGAGQQLESDTTNAEVTNSNFASFDSDGFTVVGGTAYNLSGNSYVAWCWKAGGTAVTNTDGSITSQVSANVDAGFSIVSFTAPSSSNTVFTVGHGLNSAPELIIEKERDGVLSWLVYSDNLPNPKDNYLYLNLTNAYLTDTNFWGTALPTSSVFGMKTSLSINASKNAIAYCFHSVDGFSKFGSYVGNGSTNGPFVYTGFRPAFVMIKATSRTGSWEIVDNERSGYNGKNDVLYANLSDAEYSGATYPFELLLSNGFKLTSNQLNINESGQTYIYMAFAEAPFKNAVAR